MRVTPRLLGCSDQPLEGKSRVTGGNRFEPRDARPDANKPYQARRSGF
jgi:hypothetical protein